MWIPRKASVAAALVAGLGTGLTAGAAVKAPFEDIELDVLIGNNWCMRLAARGGEWEPATRAKPSFNLASYGYVTESAGTPEHFTVAMQLCLDGGSRSPGHTFYRMTFERRVRRDGMRVVIQ